eukprot:TRINITY_DN41473_c0_g1_i1.p1 TRINITY_DN41473_c0_g1~~TRINITY_DN41473_c0_g1_i1.p1  ORF type:complete len:650 (-),score=192.12 TRINITY_DN41473_c0_g1_i1:32-1981(-)
MRVLAVLFLCSPLAAALKAARGDAGLGDGDVSSLTASEPTGYELAPDAVKEVMRVLKALGKRVELRDERESRVHDEFGDYCSHGTSALEKSLQESKAELPALHVSILELERKRQSLGQETQPFSDDQAAALAALADSESIHKDEVKALEAELSVLRANEAKLEKLLADKSLSTLQPSQAGATLLQILSGTARDRLAEMLQGSGGPYAADLGQAMDIIQTTHDSVKKDIQRLVERIAQHEASFAAMEKAKKQELKSLKRSLQEKKERDAAFFQQLTRMKSRESELSAIVIEAEELVNSLRSWCGLRRSQHSETHSALAAREMEALQRASKSLISQGGPEIFRPEASASSSGSDTLVTFVQVQSRRSNGQGLDKVTHLVDSMISVFEKEQQDADLKIRMCKDELHSAAEDRGVLSEEAKAKAADLASLADQLEEARQEVSKEKKAVVRVDWIVATATKLREKTHKLFANSIAQGAAAADVLYQATNGLDNYLKEGGSLILQPVKSNTDEFGFLTESASTGPDSADAMKALRSVLDAVRSEVKDVKAREVADQAAYEKLLSSAKNSRRKHAHSLTEFVGGEASLASESKKIQDKQKALKDQLGLTGQLSATLESQCLMFLASYESASAARKSEIATLKTKEKALDASLAGNV